MSRQDVAEDGALPTAGQLIGKASHRILEIQFVLAKLAAS